MGTKKNGRETVANSILDYCIAAFGIVFVISLIQWFIDGRNNFTGPRVEVDLLAAEVAPEKSGTEAEVAQQQGESLEKP